MAISIQEIKDMLDAGLVEPSEDDVISKGSLRESSGRIVKYRLHHGWDIARARACDRSWGQFNLALLEFIKAQAYDAATLRKVLSGVQLDDSHWRWLDKSCCFRTDEYDWFFLVANGTPQGACLIYHPKPSAIERGDIFYIEYVAVAPWNRPNPMQDRLFTGVAPIIIGYAIGYARVELGLKPGFSLHALPKAVRFYEGIGMVRHDPLDKDGLPYFEMPGDGAVALERA